MIKLCEVCGGNYMVQNHHIFFGPNRKISDKYKCCQILLCKHHHDLAHNKIPKLDGRAFDLELKRKAQTEWEQTRTREEFIKEFGKNYL